MRAGTGAWTRPVLGGHTAGFNEHTFAAVALGNFESFAPASAQMCGDQRLAGPALRLEARPERGEPDRDRQPGVGRVLRSRRATRGVRWPPCRPSRATGWSTTRLPGQEHAGATPGDPRTGRWLLQRRHLGADLNQPHVPGRHALPGDAGLLRESGSHWTADVISPCSDTPVRSLQWAHQWGRDHHVQWDLKDSVGRSCRCRPPTPCACPGPPQRDPGG